jgi:hypothetical protein
MRGLGIGIAAVLAVGCKKPPRPYVDPPLAIEVPSQPVTLEALVAQARAFAEQDFGGDTRVWLNHVEAPGVAADGTLTVGGDPIEISFSGRAAHELESCRTLTVTADGWWRSYTGCDEASVQGHCTAQQILARARAAGAPDAPAHLRLYPRRSTATTPGAELWDIRVDDPAGGKPFALTLPDDC